MKELVKEFWRYGQVKFSITMFGFIYSIGMIDYLGLTAFVTGVIWISIMGVGTFVIHKLKGAKF